MGIAEIVVLGLTAVILLINIIVGAKRGRNRSILRFILVAGCGAGAYFLKDTLVKLIGGIKIGGDTIIVTVNNLFTSMLPEGSEELAGQLATVLMGVACFFVGLILLLILSGIIIYPICKLFVKKEDKDKNKDLPNIMPNGRKRKPKVRKGFGAFVGLLQGVLVAILFLGPISGLATTAGEVASIEVEENKPLFDVSAYGLDTYSETITAKVYDVTGGWLYSDLLIANDEEGNKIDFSGIKEIAEAAGAVSQGSTTIMSTVEKIKSSDADEQTFKDLATSLQSMGKALNELPENSQELLDSLSGVIVDLVGDSISLPQDFKFSDVDVEALGTAIDGLSPILGSLASGNGVSDAEITADSAEKIVSGLADNVEILDTVTDMLGSSTISLSESQKSTIGSEILNNQTISESTKSKLSNLFGLTNS